MKIKRILVSQPKPTEADKSPYTQLAEKFNLNIEYFKFIRIEGLTAKEFRTSRVNILDHTAIIFTSRHAVDHFFRLAKDLRVEIPDTMKYFCLSESTAFYLQKYVQFRKRKIFFGKQTFNDLMDLIKKHRDENFLLPCSDIHKQEIPDALSNGKIKFTQAVIYQTLASDLSSIDINKYDMLVLFSPAGVKSLFKNFPDYQQNGTLIAAFGPTTSKAVTDSGLSLTIGAPTKTAPSMSMAIEQYLEKNNKAKK